VTASSRFLSFTFAAFLLAATPAIRAETAASGHTLAVNGIDLYYETHGEGEPLVLLHSGTQTGRMFEPFLEDLAAHYRLIVPDLRGHGRSTNPTGEWSTRQFARDIFALLDHLGIERFRGIGASAGAMKLLHMATQQPERVEAMVVVGVGTWLPAGCRSILATTDVDAYPEAAWESLRSKHVHGDEQIRALFGWIASLATSYNDMVFTPDLLSTITARTLVVHGDRDYCFPASMAWEIYSAIPEAYLWVVPNGDHVPIRGPRAEGFAETALEFLEGAWERR
jgi:pimeloyl-ACP methyl ester carboxylesterase